MDHQILHFHASAQQICSEGKTRQSPFPSTAVRYLHHLPTALFLGQIVIRIGELLLCWTINDVWLGCIE
jgi:hypothetical protein